MFGFLICMVGVIITGGSLVVGTPYMNEIIYGVMGCLFVSYGYFFLVRKKNLKLNSPEKALMCFLVIGLLQVLLSYAGVNQSFKRLDVYFDKSFIPRQAIYLFMLPVIFLFQDDFYTKAKEYLLNNYGEILFWVLYILELVLVRDSLLVSAQLLLGWMALRVKSPQRWRNLLRYAAVLFIPFPYDGESTVLILRFVFIVTLMFPYVWNRTAMKWAAIGLMAILLVVSFVVPMMISDTEFISDHNTRWRMNYWIDAMQNLKNTYMLGTGYGTSYPSKPFAAITPDFYAKHGYTRTERTFVLACHNSLVSVAMRTGIAGIAAFLLFIILMIREFVRYAVPADRAAFFALFGAVVVIAFNVGLESPNYMLSFLFCMGECNQEVKRLRHALPAARRLPGKWAWSPEITEG